MNVSPVLCDICDEIGAEDVYHGVIAHYECLPGHWQRDIQKRDEFLEAARRRLDKWPVT